MVSEAVAQQRMAELERAPAVSERCLISLTKALVKEGYRCSATSAKELIGMIHNIRHNQPRNRLN